jgi:hypothetical protein
MQSDANRADLHLRYRICFFKVEKVFGEEDGDVHWLT